MARLNGLRFFLTYAQCNDANITRAGVADSLYLLQPDFVEVAEEHHADDGIHYHAVICFSKRKQNGMDYFDLTFGGIVRHPNIRPIRNAGKDLFYRRHYIRKEEKEPHDTAHRDGPCCYTGEPESRGYPPAYSSTQEAERYTWGTLIETCNTRAEFMQQCRTYFPKDYVLRNDALQSFAASEYSNPQKDGYVPRKREEFVVPPEMDAWVEEVLGKVRHAHAYLFLLILTGVLIVRLLLGMSRTAENSHGLRTIPLR